MTFSPDQEQTIQEWIGQTETTEVIDVAIEAYTNLISAIMEHRHVNKSHALEYVIIALGKAKISTRTLENLYDNCGATLDVDTVVDMKLKRMRRDVNKNQKSNC